MILLHYAGLVISFVAGSLAAPFVSLYSTFSLASLFSALFVAVVCILLKRRPEKSPHQIG